MAAPQVAGLVAAVTAFLLLAAGGDEPPAASAPSGQAGQAVFVRMGCGGCHTLAAANAQGEIGPDLDARLPSHTAATLRARILDPPTSAEFAQMPTDFGDRMSDTELDALVAFLLASRGDRR